MAGTEHHPAGGHETRDVNVRAVTGVGLGITGGVVIALFLMWFLFDRFAATAKRLDTPVEPMAASNPQKEPPEPRLQPSPTLDLKTFRAGEDAILNSYGWVDPAKGIVRIPVERALELVAKEGLPTRKEEPRR